MRKKLIDLITDVVENIFDGENVSPIIAAIKSGNANAAKQEYAKTNFNYYMSKKKDEGVLYISLVKDPIMTVYFKDADELAASGLRLNAGTAYITSVSDVRLPYPQIEIIDTRAGPSGTGAGGGADAQARHRCHHAHREGVVSEAVDRGRVRERDRPVASG